MDNEIWKEFALKYEISNYGNIKSNNKNGNLKPYKKENFLRIDTTEKYPKKSYYVHRLVAEYFIVNPDKTKYTMIHHIDMNKHNNVYTNLKWVQQYEYFQLNKQKITQIKPNLNNPFYQFDLNGILIKKWDNLIELKKANPTYTIKYINKCLKNKTKTSYDYIWSYSETCNIIKLETKSKPNIIKSKAKSKINNKDIKPIKSYCNPYNPIFELWRNITNYEKYAISNLGNVKSKIDGKLLKPQLVGEDYFRVNLRGNNNEQKSFAIHILVATHFIFNKNPLINIVVDHIDENKLNNNYSNLRWVSRSQNTKYYYDNNKYKRANAILQYDKNNVLIKEWKCVKEIIDQTQYDGSNIYNSLNKNITAYGFIWKYKNEQLKNTVKLASDEIFKNCGTIEGYNMSKYEISNYGNVKSLSNNEIMKLQFRNGYYRITFKINNKEQKIFLIHRLVAYLFIPNNNQSTNVVNHIDKNKLNNYYKNLEWVTQQKNVEHSIAKKIQQIDVNTGNILNIFNSIKSVCSSLNIKRSTGIIKCCNNKIDFIYGYKWQYDDKILQQNVILKQHINKKQIQPTKKRNIIYSNGKKIAQIDPITKKIINIYNSISLANNALNIKINSNNISQSCNKKIGIAYGYNWCFVDNNDYKVGDIINIEIPQKMTTRKINQIEIENKNENVINTFDSIKQACDSLNIKYNSSITKCCKNKIQSAYGYKWQYVE